MSSQSYIYNPTERTLAAAGDGFSCPRLTTAGRTALSLTANDKGMMVYDTTLTDLCIWNGSAWEFVTDNSNGCCVSIKDFGAKGDGVSDDTASIQAAINSIAATGGCVCIPTGTYIVSNTITLPSKVSIAGSGIASAVISATLAMTNLQDVFYANTSTFVTICNISILGNTNGTNGAGSAIHFKNGSNNSVSNVYIENTTQAGIRLEEQNNSSVDSCTLNYCGRTGYADNHGIMVYSAAGSVIANYSIKITNNKIRNSFRKGITTYGPNASVYDLLIDGNTITSSGLANIYVGGPNQSNIRITNNYVNNGYVNMQIGPISNSVIDGNSCDTSTYSNILLFDSINVILSNNTISNSGVHGIDFDVAGTRNSQVVTSGNIIYNSNRTSAGFGCGLYINNSDNTLVSSNVVFDLTGSILSTHGIVDSVGSTNSQIQSNTVFNVASKYLIQSPTALLQDVTFGQTFDFLSGFKVQQTNTTLVNGGNDNVALPARTGVLRITGPTAVYQITGIAGGTLGRQLTLVNDTNFALTLVINSGSSSAGNRLYLSGSVNKTVPAYSSVMLMYVTAQGNNFWTDV